MIKTTHLKRQQLLILFSQSSAPDSRFFTVRLLHCGEVSQLCIYMHIKNQFHEAGDGLTFLAVIIHISVRFGPNNTVYTILQCIKHLQTRINIYRQGRCKVNIFEFPEKLALISPHSL